MTHREADRLAKQLARACPDLVVGVGEKRGPGAGWHLTVHNPRTVFTFTLSDALSVQAYQAARQIKNTDSGQRAPRGE